MSTTSEADAMSGFVDVRLGSGVGLVAGGVRVLLDADSTHLAGRLWDAISASPTLPGVLDALTAVGLPELGSFVVGIDEPDGSTRLLVRGDGRAKVAADGGVESVAASSVQTWVEHIVADSSWVGFWFASGFEPDVDEHGGSGPTADSVRLSGGYAPASAMWWRSGGVTPDAASTHAEPVGAQVATGDTPTESPSVATPDEPATTHDSGVAGEPAAHRMAARGVPGSAPDPPQQPAADPDPMTEPPVASEPTPRETATVVRPADEPPAEQLLSTGAAPGAVPISNVPQPMAPSAAAAAAADAVDRAEEPTPSVAPVDDGATVVRPRQQPAQPSTPAAETPTKEATLEVQAAAPVRATPQVQALMCVRRHPNPTHRVRCGVCGHSLGVTPELVDRPQLGVLRLADGRSIDIDRPAIVGSSPSAPDGISGEDPIVVRLADPRVAANHVRIKLEGWNAYIEDLGTGTGTQVTAPDREPVLLHPHEQVLLEPGSTVELGGTTSFSFVAPN